LVLPAFFGFDGGDPGDGGAVDSAGDVLVMAGQGGGGGADDIRQGLDIGAGGEGLGDEAVAEVIGADPAGDPGAGKGVFPGGLNFFDRPAVIVDDRSGGVLVLPEPLFA